ncbi:hypothetical protein AcW1_003516 [Taiwanofungus camphoratus]|nr:hypothetical protein AcV5_002019 [Antrodia cinnamomea]KAI0941697.1 hypothetical protein AcW1_003516 [Antrodia cinnamomea]
MPVNGQMTAPRTNASTMTAATPPLPDTAGIRELLAMMKASLATIGQTFQTLNEQSAKVSTVGPTMQDVSVQIQGLRQQIRAQEKKQDLRVKEVKHMIKGDLKKQVAEEMRAQIQEQIKREIALQVREQVDIQMSEHLPVPLKKQAEESKEQLVEVKHALLNSEARRVNSVLRTSNLDDHLAVILRPDGTKSDFYPVNLRSLFSYDYDMLRALLEDHGLLEHEVREKNLNRFMSHIGVQFQLVPVPLPVDAKESVTVTTPIE